MGRLADKFTKLLAAKAVFAQELPEHYETGELFKAFELDRKAFIATLEEIEGLYLAKEVVNRRGV